MPRRSVHPRPATRAFTAVELLVGIVIVTLIAGATAASMARLVSIHGSTQENRQAMVRASDAASRIALDLQNAVRDADLLQCKVLVTDSGIPQQPRDELLVLLRSLSPARGLYTKTGFAEGDEYEAHYRVVDEPGQSAGVLWRRYDPANDGFVEGGGIASPMVQGIVSLSIEAFDGSQWLATWDSDRDGMPHALRIIVGATSEDGRDVVVARRIVALDRVPIFQDDSATDEGGGTGQAGGAS